MQYQIVKKNTKEVVAWIDSKSEADEVVIHKDYEIKAGEELVAVEEAVQQLRVYHNCQVGAVPNFYIEVSSIEEAWLIMNILWEYDEFQFNNNVKPDYCNITGLEVFNEEEKDWEEWYDELGQDIKEHFENMEGNENAED